MHYRYDEFRKMFLPRAICSAGDDQYVVFNRWDLPLGVNHDSEASHDQTPIKFEELTEETVKKLSWENSPDARFIELYDDECIPTEEPHHMKAYLKRLAVLAKLRVC